MFSKKEHEPTGLEQAIDDILLAIQDVSPDTKEYAAMVDQLVKLHKLKEDERPSRVTPDQLVAIAAHLAGIVLIVGYERTNVVTSKAIGFVQKLK